MNFVKADELDPQQVDAFAGRMIGILNGGALSLMTSIGHRTGLFDTMAGMKPATSQTIAEAAGLDERYVREWLGAMVTGQIVNYEPETMTYGLPAEHAAVLSRESEASMAVTAQFIGMLGEVESEIVERFRNGGGIGYGCFHRFHSVMAEESGQTVVAALQDHILPLAPGLIERLQSGIDVLDVGCGSGRAMCALGELYPNSNFTGYDFCSDAVQAGIELAEIKGLTNVRFEKHDAADLGGTTFDLVCAFDSIHDQAAPDKVLSEIHRVLKPGGTFLMQDIAGSSYVEQNIDHPVAPLMYTISCMHCMTVSLAQDGAGLGAMWGRDLACQMLEAAGLQNIRVEQLEHDILNYYYLSNKSEDTRS